MERLRSRGDSRCRQSAPAAEARCYLQNQKIFFLIRNLMELNFYLQIEANLDQIGAKDKASGHHKSSDELCYHHLKEGGKNY